MRITVAALILSALALPVALRADQKPAVTITRLFFEEPRQTHLNKKA